MMNSYEEDSLEQRDMKCNDFDVKLETEGGEVFATHTGIHESKEGKKTYYAVQFWRSKAQIDKRKLEKAALYQRSGYSRGGSSPPKPQDPVVAQFLRDGFTEIGAAWIDKNDPQKINVKMKDNSYRNLMMTQLVRNEKNQLTFTNESTGAISYFVDNTNPNPKAPKYKVFATESEGQGAL